MLLRPDPGPLMIHVPGVPLSAICVKVGCSCIHLVQMDIQGHEGEVLRAFFSAGHEGTASRITSFLIGTHGREVHDLCAHLLRMNGYIIDVDQPYCESQPDGILAAHLPTWRGRA